MLFRYLITNVVKYFSLQDCGEVERITNGSVNVTGTTYGQNATYRCDPGFEISDVNGTERECSADGNWTGQQPSCIIKGQPHCLKDLK